MPCPERRALRPASRGAMVARTGQSCGTRGRAAPHLRTCLVKGRFASLESRGQATAQAAWAYSCCPRGEDSNRKGGQERMSAEPEGYTLDISEHLFRLTTESLRLRSNQTLRYQTLASLVNERAAEALGIEGHDCATLRDHLVTIPTQGNIRIDLSISRTSARSLEEVKSRLEKYLCANLTLGDALSILLFDYIVEQKAGRLIEKLGFDDGRDSSRDAQRAGQMDEKAFNIR